jgi:hypothetical protein
MDHVRMRGAWGGATLRLRLAIALHIPNPTAYVHSLQDIDMVGCRDLHFPGNGLTPMDRVLPSKSCMAVLRAFEHFGKVVGLNVNSFDLLE